MARTYKRDGNGRFAGGGGSSGGGGSKRPAAKSVSRGVNRLTRDNAGKITSVGGSGATARGGRLKTAAGNKRAMQTAKVSGGRPAGTMKGKIKRDPGAAGKVGQGKAAAPSKKRVLVRMDARPQNLFSRTSKKSDGYGTDAKANVANARKQIEKAGAMSALKSNKRSRTVASVSERSPKQVDINASHSAWRNPRKGMIQNRKKNEFSTTSPGHYVAHELGHVRHPSSKMARSWDVQLRGKGQVYADANKVVSAQRMARRVSKYAMTEPAEFAAETRAARSLGKKYDSKVMSLYRNVTGTKLPSLKSQQKKKGASSGYVSPRAKTAKPVATPKPAATAKNRASEMRKRAAQLDQRGNALMGGGRRDTAAVNLSLNSSARRNETNAGFKGLEMTRNAERLRSKAGRIEYRSNESRAKKLRSVHETPIAKGFAKKAGKSVTEVRAAIRSMTPEKQIKMFKQHVKETRSAAKRKRKP